MYHNQPDRIELHDDVVGVENSRLEVKKGQPVRLHMSYVLRPDREYASPEDGAAVRVHSTNGVQHRWYELGQPDPALSAFVGDERVQPVENGQNRAIFHDDSGEPLVTADPVVDDDAVQVNAPNSAYETRRYASDLNYHPEDFAPDETDETRRMRRQQDLVDTTTAQKRRDGVGSGTPANSLREDEANAEEKREQKREEKREQKREEKKDK